MVVSFRFECFDVAPYDVSPKVMEEKINPDNVEVASVTEKGYQVYTADKLTEVLQRL